VASLIVDQLDRCNLLWRSIVCYGTGKTSDWTVLRMIYLSAFFPVQIFVPAQRDTAHHLIEQAGVALVYLGIVATFAAFSLIACVIWLLIW
jgi:hypothetical protein